VLAEYVGVFLYFGLMLLAGVLFIALSHWLQSRVRTDKYDWSQPYECGLKTPGLELERFPIHYYLVGIMFVVFDVETVFLIPWALVGHSFKALDGGAMHWFLVMLPFFLLLVVGYGYDVASGILDWGHAGREQDIEEGDQV
jgi:NADH-quinone oxidoreductase subunit A